MDLSQARYARMRWNTPLSLVHAELLLDRLEVPPDSSVLDVGCGWGELMIRAVAAAGARATGVGVDNDESGLDRGRRRAGELDLADRVRFVNADGGAWSEPADRVLCIGAAHAWNGTREALVALQSLTRPDGRLLYGDACWTAEPSATLAGMFDEVLPLQTVVAHAVAAGWRVLHLSTADQREWDDFESTWRAGRQLWLVEHPDDDRAAEVREKLDAQLEDYIAGYRGILGFCYSS